MLSHSLKALIPVLLYSLNIATLCSQEQVNMQTKALDIGAYEYARAAKKRYKIYYDEEADAKLMSLVSQDEELAKSLGFELHTDSLGKAEYFIENQAYEYCPELGYILMIGGHGYITPFDLINKKRIHSNPTSYVYSPSKKYRFSSLLDDGMRYFLDVKEGDEYISCNIYFASKVHGVYWVDEETIHYLRERTRADGSIYWVAYSSKFSLVSK